MTKIWSYGKSWAKMRNFSKVTELLTDQSPGAGQSDHSAQKWPKSKDFGRSRPGDQFSTRCGVPGRCFLTPQNGKKSISGKKLSKMQQILGEALEGEFDLFRAGRSPELLRRFMIFTYFWPMVQSQNKKASRAAPLTSFTSCPAGQRVAGR